MSTATTLKFRVGRFLYPVSCVRQDARLFLKFGFNRGLIDEVKAMAGARWREPPPDVSDALGGAEKCWDVSDNERNWFQINYLQGMPVYTRWDGEIKDVVPLNFRPEMRSYQRAMLNFLLTRGRCLLAGQTGVGKTLPALAALEWAQPKLVYYIAPRSALYEVQSQLLFWKYSGPVPMMFTYEGLVTLHKGNLMDTVPDYVIFDECQRIKTPGTQRSQAAMWLADKLRETHPDGKIIGMSGTPAPKSPADWWHVCEVIAPGFLREGTVEKFVARMAVVKEEEGPFGKYRKVIAWKDGPNRCAICGSPSDKHVDCEQQHNFAPCTDEVTNLGTRLNGLVGVWTKSQCLSELPEKVFRDIICDPSKEQLRAARLIARRSIPKIERLTLLRELSDGIQYNERKGVEAICPTCRGDCEIIMPGESEKIECPKCEGTGFYAAMERVVDVFHSPKDDAFLDLLKDFDSEGRFVTYAAFTGTVDKICNLAWKSGWHVIRADGRGWFLFDPDGQLIRTDIPLLSVFQTERVRYERVLFTGQASSAGVGITLTASPALAYYSCDFNGEARKQSMDRIHRLGMDTNKGATIFDLLCLETDRMIRDNLDAKGHLEDVVIESCFTAGED